MNSDSVREFVRREVPGWDDEVVSTARFKAFSGQRPDWEPRYHFWKDLIIKVARHFGLLIIQPSQVHHLVLLCYYLEIDWIRCFLCGSGLYDFLFLVLFW